MPDMSDFPDIYFDRDDDDAQRQTRVQLAILEALQLILMELRQKSSKGDETP